MPVPTFCTASGDRKPEGQASDLDPAAEADLGLVMDVIGAVRNIRGEMGLNPGQALPLVVMAHHDHAGQVLRQQAPRVAGLARLSDIAWVAQGQGPAKAASAAVSGLTLYVPLEGLVDFAAEVARLDKEIAKLAKEAEPSRKKLLNEGFLAKAPAEVVEKERAKVEAADSKSERLRASLERMKSFL